MKKKEILKKKKEKKEKKNKKKKKKAETGRTSLFMRSILGLEVNDIIAL